MKRAKKPRNPTKPVTETQVWLAKQLKISQPRVCKLMADPDWPVGKGPWSKKEIEELRHWMADRRAMNNATAGAFDDDAEWAEVGGDTLNRFSKNPERLAKIKLIIERTAKIKLERELLAGGYLKREDVENRTVAQINAIRGRMQQIPLRAGLIAHKDESACSAILSDWMREVCEAFETGAAA